MTISGREPSVGEELGMIIQIRWNHHIRMLVILVATKRNTKDLRLTVADFIWYGTNFEKHMWTRSRADRRKHQSWDWSISGKFSRSNSCDLYGCIELFRNVIWFNWDEADIREHISSLTPPYIASRFLDTSLSPGMAPQPDDGWIHGIWQSWGGEMVDLHSLDMSCSMGFELWPTVVETSSFWGSFRALSVRFNRTSVPFRSNDLASIHCRIRNRGIENKNDQRSHEHAESVKETWCVMGTYHFLPMYRR